MPKLVVLRYAEPNGFTSERCLTFSTPSNRAAARLAFNSIIGAELVPKEAIVYEVSSDDFGQRFVPVREIYAAKEAR